MTRPSAMPAGIEGAAHAGGEAGEEERRVGRARMEASEARG